MHPALKNIKVQYMKHDWASLQSSKITWKPCSVGIFLGYPTRPRGLRSAGWVFATRETLQILMASRVTVSNTPGAQKLLTLKTHQTIKHPNFCRLVVFFQLVGQKHPQVRCLTSRPMIFSHTSPYRKAEHPKGALESSHLRVVGRDEAPTFCRQYASVFSIRVYPN